MTTIESLPVGAQFNFRYIADFPYTKISETHIRNETTGLETAIAGSLTGREIIPISPITPKRSWFKEFLEGL